MNIWVISDLHLNHQNILKYGRGDHFETIEEHNEALIENFNSVVRHNDLTYFLGDLVMGKRAEGLPLLERLNGSKVAIWGNHDYPHSSNSEKIVNKWTWEYSQYFDLVAGEQHSLSILDQDVLLCHFPSGGDHTEEERYPEFRPETDGWLMHGHLHCPDIQVAPKHIHVGVDADYTEYGVERYHPIPLEVIKEVMTNAVHG